MLIRLWKIGNSFFFFKIAFMVNVQSELTTDNSCPAVDVIYLSIMLGYW